MNLQSVPTQHRKPSISTFSHFAKYPPAPEYSKSPSELASGFELKAIGNVFRTKDKYLCGDILDNRFFLIGTSSGLDVIDLSLPKEKQSAKRIINSTRFKQIKIVKTRKHDGFLLAICGRNSHLRCYTLFSVKILIFAQLSKISPTPSPVSPPPVSPSKRQSKRLSNPFFQSRPDRAKRASLQPTLRYNFSQTDFNSHETYHQHDLYTSSHNISFYRATSSSGSLSEIELESSGRASFSEDEEFVDAITGEEEIVPARPMSKGIGIFEDIISLRSRRTSTEKVSVSVGLKTSVTATTSYSAFSDTRHSTLAHGAPQLVSQSRSNRISISAFSFPSLQNTSAQGKKKPVADFTKLPQTKYTLSFAASVGLVRSYVATLAKQNIYLFEMSHDENMTYKQEWIHTRTYWLPSTPDYLELAVRGEQLVDIIAAFGSEIVLIGVEDSRIKEVAVANEFKSGDYHALDDAETQVWRTFSQLSFLPCVNPENVSDTFTIPPSYALASASPPSSFLHPTPVFEAADTVGLFCSAPLLFFATYGSKSMIVDSKGRPFSTTVFEWSFPLLSVFFFRGDVGTNDAYVVGFGKDIIEIRSFRTGLVIENVVRGAEVTFLGSGRNDENEVILACRFEKGIKGVDLYSLKAPIIP